VPVSKRVDGYTRYFFARFVHRKLIVGRDAHHPLTRPTFSLSPMSPSLFSSTSLSGADVTEHKCPYSLAYPNRALPWPGWMSELD
jgi:hypothetical protein